MPKAYTDREKEIIKDSLKKTAFDCLTQYGIRKTTVDEIVKRVNIPKGTFYLFYKSKELLLFDAFNDVHNKIQTKIIENLSALSDLITADELTNIIFDCFKIADAANIIKILSNGELELLIRKLPNEIIIEHLNHDDDIIKQMINAVPNAKNKSIQDYSGAFRAIFLASLYKKEIGEDNFDNAIYMLIKGLVSQLID